MLNELKVAFEIVEAYMKYNKLSTSLNFMTIKHQLRDDLNFESMMKNDVTEEQKFITINIKNMMHDAVNEQK